MGSSSLAGGSTCHSIGRAAVARSSDGSNAHPGREGGRGPLSTGRSQVIVRYKGNPRLRPEVVIEQLGPTTTERIRIQRHAPEQAQQDQCDDSDAGDADVHGGRSNFSGCAGGAAATSHRRRVRPGSRRDRYRGRCICRRRSTGRSRRRRPVRQIRLNVAATAITASTSHGPVIRHREAARTVGSDGVLGVPSCRSSSAGWETERGDAGQFPPDCEARPKGRLGAAQRQAHSKQHR